MSEFKTTIRESSRELTARERIMCKDISNALKLDAEADNKTVLIKPSAYAILDVHNEKSDNPDYVNYVIFDDEANKKYVTGSPSFWNAFKSIWDEMSEEGEGFSVEAYKLDSKNYKGKKFLTCSIV